MNKELIVPNTILLGAQKAATTSVHRWLAQHPDVCAPEVLKDFPYFYNREIYAKGLASLSRIYQKTYTGQAVVFQGCVSYIYDEDSLKRIKADCPDARFVLVIRNPVERAISAYYFARQRGLETRPIREAFQEEEAILSTGNAQEKLELTYMKRGLYYEQLQVFNRYFDRANLHVMFFEDIKKDREEEMKKLFNFLNIDDSFQPDWVFANKTGQAKSSKLLRWIYKDTKAKKWLVDKIIDPLMPVDAKIKLKWAMANVLVRKKGAESRESLPPELRRGLYDYYQKDVEQLEIFLNKDLSGYKMTPSDV